MIALTVLVAAPAAAQTHRRVSVSADGEPGNGDSFGPPAVSAEGRYVAFVSEASNLVPDDENGVADVFRYDLVTGEVVRVSVGSGGEEGDRPSGLREPGGARGPIAAIDMSTDGNLVVFASAATTLGPDDGVGDIDVWLRDISLSTTTRLSPPPMTGGRGGGVNPRMSDDGSVVVFQSDQWLHGVNEAFNTIDDDIFAWTRAGALEWITSIDGMEADPGGDSTLYDIGPNGRLVTFVTRSTGLTGGVDRRSDVVIAERGVGFEVVEGGRRQLTWAAYGGRMAFVTGEALVSEDDDTAIDVYVQDLDTGDYYLASPGEPGSRITNAMISRAGTHVVFDSERDVYVYDVDLDTLVLVSSTFDGDLLTGFAEAPVISSGGETIAYVTNGANLIDDGVLGQHIVVTDPAVTRADLYVSTFDFHGSMRDGRGEHFMSLVNGGPSPVPDVEAVVTLDDARAEPVFLPDECTFEPPVTVRCRTSLGPLDNDVISFTVGWSYDGNHQSTVIVSSATVSDPDLFNNEAQTSDYFTGTGMEMPMPMAMGGGCAVTTAGSAAWKAGILALVAFGLRRRRARGR